jgi:DUF2934 family protein
MVVGISLSFVQTEKGITMRSSQGNNKEKQTGPKVKAKAQPNETRDSQRKPKDRELDDTTHKDASTSPIGHVVTEDQYRARVSQKAYELYQKRQAVTHLEDWLEAERLVKAELLAEGQWAGSV